MLEWITNNLGNLIALGIVSAALIAALLSLRRDKKKGKTCSCGCGGCSGSCPGCHQ